MDIRIESTTPTMSTIMVIFFFDSYPCISPDLYELSAINVRIIAITPVIVLQQQVSSIASKISVTKAGEFPGFPCGPLL